MQEHQGKRPPNNPQDPNWLRWRANKITEYMKRVLQAVKDQQNCLVSLAPNSACFYDLFFLGNMERQGLIDELILQVYRMTSIFSLVNWSYQKCRQRRHIPVSIGNASKRPLCSSAQIQNQVEAVRKRGLLGCRSFLRNSVEFGEGEASSTPVYLPGTLPSIGGTTEYFDGWTIRLAG